MKREELAAMGPLQRKQLLEDVALLVHSGEWRLGEAVRFLRKVVLRRSRPRFARLVGVSPAALQQLEDWPDANPTLDTLNRVFAPFGASVGLVFPRMHPAPERTTELQRRHSALRDALKATHRARRLNE